MRRNLLLLLWLLSCSWCLRTYPRQPLSKLLVRGRDFGINKGMTEQGNFSITRAASTVAVVYIAGRTDFLDVLDDAVLQYVRMAGVYRCDGKPRNNFLKALESATVAFPEAAWYYIADDDSFVHLERLSKVVDTFDSTEYHIIGAYDYATANVQCQRGMMTTEGPGWLCGGPGILLSAPLAHAMSALNCSETYGGTDYWNPKGYNGGDVELGCCAWDVWPDISFTNLEDIFVFEPEKMLNGVPDMGKDLVSVHHLDPQATRLLGAHNAHLMKQ